MSRLAASPLDFALVATPRACAPTTACSQPNRYLDLFSVVPNSTPRPRCVNSQVFHLPPVGIFNSLCSIYNVWLFIFIASPISATLLNTFGTEIKRYLTLLELFSCFVFCYVTAIYSRRRKAERDFSIIAQALTLIYITDIFRKSGHKKNILKQLLKTRTERFSQKQAPNSLITNYA